jgi:GNAT superfamily N-acetyltransferase
MAVIRHVIDVQKPAIFPLKHGEWSVGPWETGAGIDSLERLVRACSADHQPAPRLSPAGLRAELAGREGRAAFGFAARCAAVGRDADIVGFAVVIEAVGGRGCRHSLAWLLVHPAVRRQGVATALLAEAFACVRARGGAEICVETLGIWPDAVAFWRRVTA